MKPRVLFACWGNTCRSVFAEFIAKKDRSEEAEFCSAGFNPQRAGHAEDAIYILKCYGIDASMHVPRHISEIGIEDFDLVIAMDRVVANELKTQFPSVSADRLLKWDIDDPFGDGDSLPVYKKCFQQIRKKVRDLSLSGDRGPVQA